MAVINWFKNLLLKWKVRKISKRVEQNMEYELLKTGKLSSQDVQPEPGTGRWQEAHDMRMPFDSSTKYHF